VRAIWEVRDWLATASGAKGLPGGREIGARYLRFVKQLPKVCRRLKRNPKDLTFGDFSEMVEIWLKDNADSSKAPALR
jgi:hypothetical protein